MSAKLISIKPVVRFAKRSIKGLKVMGLTNKKVACSNPRRGRPKLLKQVVTAPPPNAR